MVVKSEIGLFPFALAAAFYIVYRTKLEKLLKTCTYLFMARLLRSFVKNAAL